jgi:DMSO/TMAO reductase YedYZ heme-binding membrane subunit
MKKPLLFAAVICCLALTGFSWARALTPGLPWSVYLYEGARLLALLAFVLMFFQFVLSSKIPWVERGLGQAALFKIHRRWGLIVFVLLLSHPALLILSERLQGYSSPISPVKILGVLTLVVLSAAALAALLARRLHLKVQTWKKVHKAVYLVFPLGFVHGLLIGTTLQKGPSRALWLILAVAYVAIVGNKALRISSKRHQV